MIYNQYALTSKTLFTKNQVYIYEHKELKLPSEYQVGQPLARRFEHVDIISKSRETYQEN
jgi:hypothetical protein